MTDPDTISADYTLRPADLAATLKVVVETTRRVHAGAARTGRHRAGESHAFARSSRKMQMKDLCMPKRR